ncbi:MAG: substrate-binding domain-containing protein [Candidatus Omnitrophica bacterium]|nr:substrate-binding domain-containing protein [Candidatus Omnitrophota bacterium]
MSDILDRIPKYMKIKEILRQEIEEGLLKDGEKIAPESALIKRFQASKMTIIHALQELVEEGYMRREQGRGTFVTYSGRRSPLIAVLVPPSDLRPLTFLMDGIETAAGRLECELVSFKMKDDKAACTALADRLISLKTDGAIVCPVDGAVNLENCQLWFNQLKKYEIPVVILDLQSQKPMGASLIKTNNENAMAELTRRVIKLGHRRLLLIRTGKYEYLNTAARINGFLRAVYQYNDFVESFHILSYNENDSMDARRHIVQSFMEEFHPTALMALNDHIAIDLMRILKSLPDNIHKKVSVTGFDDLPFAEFAGLTTVYHPFHEVGEKAMEMLHAMIKKGKRPYSITIPSTVVIRDSLKPPAKKDGRFSNTPIS